MKRRSSNSEERKIIRTLDNLRLYDELMPAIRACAIAQGGAEQILKKSEVLAALQLVESLDSDKDDVKLKASVEILNRVSGKPVERTLNIYGDISKLNERDIDSQIMKAIERSGSAQLIEAAVTTRSLSAPKIKQSRKPRKSDPIGNPEPQNQT